MKDTADTRQGTPVVALSGRQGAPMSSLDIQYHLNCGNFPSSSNTNSASGRAQRTEEAKESWLGEGPSGQDSGKVPDSGRPAVHMSTQVSLVTRSSGTRRLPRSDGVLSMQGPWNAFSGGIDPPGLGSLDTDTDLDIAFSTKLGQEVPALAGNRGIASSEDYSLGRSLNLSLDPFSTLGGASSTDYFLGRGTGQVAVKGGDRSTVSFSLPMEGRLTGLSSNVSYHSHRKPVVDQPVGALSLGISAVNSDLMEQQRRDGQGLAHQGIQSNFSETLLTSGSSTQGSLAEQETCIDHAHSVLRSYSAAKKSHTSDGSPSGNPGSIPSASCADVKNISRASAYKRKSCTSGLLGSTSCPSGSSRSSGFREGVGERPMGGSNSSRRSSSNLRSVSHMVASASAAATGRCAETFVASSSLEERHPGESSRARDGKVAGNGTAARSFLGCSTGGNSGPRIAPLGELPVLADHEMSTLNQLPCARAVQRAIPACEPDTSSGQSLADCQHPDFGSVGEEMHGRSSAQLMASGWGRRSKSPAITISKSGSTASVRNDSGGRPFGERPSHRYTCDSNRNMASSSSGGICSFGGVGRETRLRFRNYSNTSADLMNRLGTTATQNPNLASVQGFSHSGSASGSSLLRLPSNPPVVRSRQIGALHVPTLSSSSVLGPSRLPSSHPVAASSLSSAIDMLPSESSIFHGSVLPRRSAAVAGQSDRSFGSAADNFLGFPFRGLDLSDGEQHPRLVADGLAEILLALECVERDEDLTYEQLLMLEATVLFGGVGLHDQHSDLRLDVDNMSYEELLALEERIGNVNTGLTMEMVNKSLKKVPFSSGVAGLDGTQESDLKCSVCQEEYEEGDELGKVDCGHSYHTACIKQWLIQKNRCPICKACALSS